MRKELPWWKDWIAWILQCLAWMAGIAVAIKQLMPKGSGPNKQWPPLPPTIEPDILILSITAICILGIGAGIRYWRDR